MQGSRISSWRLFAALAVSITLLKLRPTSQRDLDFRISLSCFVIKGIGPLRWICSRWFSGHFQRGVFNVDLHHKLLCREVCLRGRSECAVFGLLQDTSILAKHLPIDASSHLNLVRFPLSLLLWVSCVRWLRFLSVDTTYVRLFKDLGDAAEPRTVNAHVFVSALPMLICLARDDRAEFIQR